LFEGLPTYPEWKTLEKPYYCANIADHIYARIFIFTKSVPLIPFVPLSAPWESPCPANLEVIIPANKEEAMILWETRKVKEETLEVYTDGSKTEDGVGAGWFYSLNGQDVTGKAKLYDHSTIFQAELVAIMKVLQSIPDNINHIHIFTDSKSSIQALISSVRNQEAETVKLRNLIKSLDNKKMTLQWIPGHFGIDGNETADQLAKEATTENMELEELPTSRSTMKQMLLEIIRTRWGITWSYLKSQSQVTLSLPSLGHLNKIHKDLSLIESCIVSQFRSGHTKFLLSSNRYGKDSHNIYCQCGQIETTEHLLMKCWLYNDLRKQLRIDIRNAIGSCKWSPRVLLDNPSTIFLTLNFIKTTMKRRKELSF
jgi:ribonuclease HI